MRIHENSADEALISLPDLKPLDFKKDLLKKQYDFYISALGFEKRTLSIPENLAEISKNDGFTCDELIYLTYNTSTSDNAFNEPPLRNFLEQVKDSDGKPASVLNMFCDDEAFSQFLTDKIKNKKSQGDSINILLDISVCSSKLILMLLKIIFSINRVALTILYTEALIYYPLYEEYLNEKQKFLEDSEYSATRGHEKTVNSNEYSEGGKENPDLIIAFAPFKVGRINKIVSDIDESILLNNNGRLIWIIGDPNFPEDIDKTNRMTMLKEINSIDATDCRIHNVGTLNYKDTISTLESIYKQNEMFHINIADLGSKMQTLGISIFYHIRPDVSVYYAIPKIYNSHRYSDGVKKHWFIDFGNIKDLKKIINKIDCQEIIYEPSEGYPPFRD